jgi:parvulin-like peptidyl-prolyl isomerase
MIFYKAKHILLEDKEDAEYVLELLTSGKSFEALAKEYSECDTGKSGGDLGRFSSGTMDAKFERALYHLELNKVSKPVETKFGYHIIVRLE